MSKLLCTTLHSACDSRSADIGVPGVGRKIVSWGLSARLSWSGILRREEIRSLI